MTLCEGRCGSRLDEVGRELPPRPVDEDDYTPAHTPERCRVIRLYREAIEAELPGWDVLVYPQFQGRLMTKVERVVDNRLIGRSQGVPDAAPPGALHAFAEYEARCYAKDLARYPIGAAP